MKIVNNLDGFCHCSWAVGCKSPFDVVWLEIFDEINGKTRMLKTLNLTLETVFP